MVATAYEMVWLQSFLQDMDIRNPMTTPMNCDNQVAIVIS